MHAAAVASPTTDTRRIVALSYDSFGAAEDALATAMRFQDDELIDIEDAVFVTRGEDGRVTITERADPTPIAAAVPSSLFGAFIGTLVAGPLGFLIGGVIAGGGGALIARLVETGIPQRVVGELQELTRPGQTVLAMLVKDVAAMAIIEELRRFRRAPVVYTKVSPTAFDVVRHALGRD